MAKQSRLERALEEIDSLRERGRLTDEEHETRRAALLADTTLAEPEKGGRGNGIMKWGAFGCLGILGLIGLFLILVIVASENLSDSIDDSGGDVRVSLATGSSGEIAPENQGSRRIKVTILDIVDGADPENQFSNPQAGKKYWAVEVEVENVGSREVRSPDWKLRDSGDIEHDRTLFSGVGENLDVTFDLTPGGKLRGWVVFEIDTEAEPKWLRADPNTFAAYDLYFDTQ